MAVTVVAIPSGGEDAAFEYDSGAVALASHMITHNLGFRPNVTAVLRGTEDIIIGKPIHHSTSVLEYVFNSPHAIVARLS